jgi:hypothetical protein
VESDKEEHGKEGQDMEEAVVIESKPSEPLDAQTEELSAEEEPLTLTHPVHEERQVEVESDKEEHGEEGPDVEEAVAIESKPSEPPAAQTEEAREPRADRQRRASRTGDDAGRRGRAGEKASNGKGYGQEVCGDKTRRRHPGQEGGKQNCFFDKQDGSVEEIGFGQESCARENCTEGRG